MMQIFNLLEKQHPLSLPLKNHLAATIKAHEFKRKEIILKQGQIARRMYFITQGLVRCFCYRTTDDTGIDKDVSIWFLKEGDIFAGAASFYSQRPSPYSIHALERTTVLYMTYDELEDTYRNFPEFNIHGRKIQEQYNARSDHRVSNLHLSDSKEKYRYIQRTEPELIRRVSVKHLATYIDVTPEWLSKIRRG